MQRRHVSAVAGICAAAALLLLAGDARADECSISSTSVNFGSYNVFSSSPTDSTGSVTFRCNGNTPSLWISLSRGNSSSFSSRTLARGSEVLLYNLYLDAARTSVWGDGTSGTSAPVGPQGNTTLNVFGRVPPLQDVSAGTFSDTVMVTFYF